MIFINILIAIASFILTGMHVGLIMTNKQDKITVNPKQYLWTAIIFLNGLYFFISSIGYYSCE
jgi:hypothetical protein